MKELERQFAKTIRRVRHSNVDLALGVRPWTVFILLSAVQFTARNAKLHADMHKELASLQDFLGKVLMEACPYAEKIIDLGNAPEVDVKSDGSPVDPVAFENYLRKLSEKDKPDD